MPEINEQGLDVSAEEQRFLRRSFQRFARPYLVVGAVAFGFLYFSGGGESADVDLEPLEAQLAELAASVEALDARLVALGSGAQANEKRLKSLEARPAGGGASGDVAKLQRELREIARKLDGLDSRLAEEAPAERFAALSARIARLEGARAPAPAQPAAEPEAAPPPPAAPQASEAPQ